MDIEHAEKIFAECLDIMKLKNHDYGSRIDNIAITGLDGISVRMVDKVCRIYSLADGRENKVKDESLRQTLLDIANYANIGIQLIDGKWGK